MKKGYIRLLVFEAIIALILFLNSFVWNILSRHFMNIFLLIVLILFRVFFGLEKDRHRYFKEVLFEIFSFVMFFFIVFYLMGLVVGLAKTRNYLTYTGIKNILLPLILFSILREILRYNLLNKADGNLICTIMVVFTIFLFDITDDFYYSSFKSQYDILKFIALTLFPLISKNICYSYITKRLGYKPVIIYDLVFSLYPYLLPLIPNPSEYVVSIIYLIVPILFTYKIVNFVNKKKDDLIPSDYHRRKFKGLLLPLATISVLVYFYSGYFRYYAIAVASGSMSPKILKGDIVIVDQKQKKEKINIGDVLAYRRNEVIVVHRVVNRIEYGDSYIYYTKGDANNNVDGIVIEEDMTIGVVKVKIPYIGWPTVWFNKE